MNRFAYLSTSFAFIRLYKLSRARVRFSGTENIPDGPVIFTPNHFTRMETLFLPYHLEELTGSSIWTLAHHSLFKGALGAFIEQGGAVSTANPDRDRLVIKTLLTGESAWVIFPEGSMVKSKKVFDQDTFRVEGTGGWHRPRTGAANLALRSEFYRKRIRLLRNKEPDLAMDLCNQFGLASPDALAEGPTRIVPVNLTYYPLRARENALNWLADLMVESVSKRVAEELMTEGSMLLDGVDVDIRFGRPIDVGTFLAEPDIIRDIVTRMPFGMDDRIPSIGKLRKAARQLMEGYMSAIYSMTTVNPDHLFATILREMPDDVIDPEDLSRRVYLAASQRLDPRALYLHESLERNAISLLTDDRHGWRRDFLDFAKRIGVVEEKPDGMLLRDPERLARPYAFETARVDNPVAVMAHEIEPLLVLRPHLQRLAKEDCFHVQRRLIGHLVHEGVQRLDEERLHAPHPLTVPLELARPEVLGSGANHMGVLLVHGYLSVPAQMKELADALAARGYRVYPVCLPGHGSHPEALARTRHSRWSEAVEEGVALLRMMSRRVGVVGLDLGGLLALDLAVRLPDVAAVVCVGVPYKVGNFTRRMAPGEEGWRKLLSRLRPRKGHEQMHPFTPEDPEWSYHSQPEHMMQEMADFLDPLRMKFDRLRLPILFVQATRDPMVKPKAIRELFENVGTEFGELVMLDYDRHNLLSGEAGKRVGPMIADFFDRNLFREPTVSDPAPES